MKWCLELVCLQWFTTRLLLISFLIVVPHSGPSLITYLDNQDAVVRAAINDPVRLPIVDRYKVSDTSKKALLCL